MSFFERLLQPFVGKHGDRPVVNGMFLTELVDFVRGQQGEAGLQALTARFGRPLTFSMLKTYPIEQELQLRRAVLDQVFGGPSDQALLYLGQLSFNSVLKNPVGRQALASVDRDPVKMVSGARYFYSLFTNYGQRSFNFLSPKHAHISVIDDPEEPAYILGLIMAGLRYCSVQNPRAYYSVLGPNQYVFDITWQ